MCIRDRHGTRAAHLADLRKLGQHIVHIELVFHHPLGGLFGQLLVGGILCALDEACLLYTSRCV